MKTCDELIEYLGAYADEELEDEICERVRQHLAECESCRRAAEDMKRVSALYRESAVPEPTDAQWAKVAHAVARCREREKTVVEEPRRRRVSDWHWWLSGALAAAAVILVVFVLPHRPQEVVTPSKTVTPENKGTVAGRHVQPPPGKPTAMVDEVESTDPDYSVNVRLPRNASDTLVISLVRAKEGTDG